MDAQQQQPQQETNLPTKYILLIGKTGNGKSATGNLFLGLEDHQPGAFKVGGTVFSETNLCSTKYFVLDGVRYGIIDTIGIGDTRLEQMNLATILNRIANAIGSIEGGKLHQLFLVSKGRLTKEELEAMNVLVAVLGTEVLNNTAIIRTNDHLFRDGDHQASERIAMRTGVQEPYKQIFQNSQNIVFIDNPPTFFTGISDLEKAVNLNKRDFSKNVLVGYLGLIKNKPDFILPNQTRIQQQIEDQTVDKIKVLIDNLKSEIDKKNKDIEELQKKAAEATKSDEKEAKRFEMMIQMINQNSQQMMALIASLNNQGGGGDSGCNIL